MGLPSIWQCFDPVCPILFSNVGFMHVICIQFIPKIGMISVPSNIRACPSAWRRGTNALPLVRETDLKLRHLFYASLGTVCVCVYGRGSSSANPIQLT